MKQRNLIYGMLIAILIFNTSCTNDDDSTQSLESLIVGNWNPIREVIVCSENNENTINYSSCNQKTKLIFSSSGEVSNTSFTLDQNGNCFQDNSFSYTGTWIISDNKLIVTISEITYEYSFLEITNSTLKIGQYDSNHDPCTNGEKSSYYYFEYSRF